jgi:hypothetical protein
LRGCKATGFWKLKLQHFKLKTAKAKGEKEMGLVVSAEVIRELIADGEYMVEYIEQREHGKVAVTCALRSRAQPYNVQIETNEHQLGGLLRALLDGKDAPGERSRLTQLGGPAVPVVEVAALPADAPKARKRRRAAVADAKGTQPAEAISPAVRRSRSARQLVLMPQERPIKANQAGLQNKRKRQPRADESSERA